MPLEQYWEVLRAVPHSARLCASSSRELLLVCVTECLQWCWCNFDGDNLTNVEEDEGLDDLEDAEEEGQEDMEIFLSG